MLLTWYTRANARTGNSRTKPVCQGHCPVYTNSQERGCVTDHCGTRWAPPTGFQAYLLAPCSHRELLLLLLTPSLTRMDRRGLHSTGWRLCLPGAAAARCQQAEHDLGCRHMALLSDVCTGALLRQEPALLPAVAHLQAGPHAGAQGSGHGGPVGR